jgi:hypothetical protein
VHEPDRTCRRSGSTAFQPQRGSLHNAGTHDGLVSSFSSSNAERAQDNTGIYSVVLSMGNAAATSTALGSLLFDPRDALGYNRSSWLITPRTGYARRSRHSSVASVRRLAMQCSATSRQPVGHERFRD